MSDLRSWTETHFTELYSAHETDAFASAYSSTFAPDVSIAFADAPQRDSQGVMHVTAGQGSREERAQGEEARKALEARAKGGPQASTSRVEFTELDVDEGASTVRGVFTVHRSMKFRIRAAPATLRTTVHFKASVSGSDDSRRIVEYAQTSETHKPPINMPHLPVQPRTKGDEL